MFEESHLSVDMSLFGMEETTRFTRELSGANPQDYERVSNTSWPSFRQFTYCPRIAGLTTVSTPSIVVKVAGSGYSPPKKMRMRPPEVAASWAAWIV